MKKFLFCLLISVTLLNGVVWADEKNEVPKKEEGHGHDDMLKIGDIGFLKMGHDDDNGKVTVELFKVDKKTVLAIEGEIKLNAKVGSEKKDFVLTAKDGKYEATDEFLKKEFTGRFVFKADGKQYVVKVEDHADHNGAHGHPH